MKKMMTFSATILSGLLLTVSAKAQITYYEDTFTAGGTTGVDINGTTPDTVDTNGNTWSVTNTNTYYDYLGTNEILPTASSAYTSAFLPVNGTSGVTLNGLQPFTLSVNIIAGPSTQGGGGTGLSLFNAGGSAPLNGLAANLGGGQLLTQFEGGNTNYGAATGNESIAFNYIPNGLLTGGTLQFLQAGMVIRSETVTTVQIAALTDVGFGTQGYPIPNDGSLASPGFNDFKLTVTVPEPSTWALMLGGVMALVVISRRRTSKA